LILSAFLVNTLGPLPLAQAQDFRGSTSSPFYLPAPGVRVNLSPEFNPPILKGIKIHPDNPFRFDFILDKGDNFLPNSSTVIPAKAGIQNPIFGDGAKIFENGINYVKENLFK
jgi:hypothetical protein